MRLQAVAGDRSAVLGHAERPEHVRVSAVWDAAMARCVGDFGDRISPLLTKAGGAGVAAELREAVRLLRFAIAHPHIASVADGERVTEATTTAIVRADGSFAAAPTWGTPGPVARQYSEAAVIEPAVYWLAGRTSRLQAFMEMGRVNPGDADPFVQGVAGVAWLRTWAAVGARIADQSPARWPAWASATAASVRDHGVGVLQSLEVSRQTVIDGFRGVGRLDELPASARGFHRILAAIDRRLEEGSALGGVRSMAAPVERPAPFIACHPIAVHVDHDPLAQ